MDVVYEGVMKMTNLFYANEIVYEIYLQKLTGKERTNVTYMEALK